MAIRFLFKNCALLTVAAILLTVSDTSHRLAAQSEKVVNPKPARAAVWLPRRNQNWRNSPAITAGMLEGKAAFVWFFEETCPICAKKWPELFELSEKYSNEPVVFIAVNSGSRPPVVEQYIRKHKITWPVLLDVNRNAEKRARVNKISLENIYSLRMITPTGQTVRGDTDDLEGSIEKQLKTAKWNIDANKIAQEHQVVWRMIEFKQYTGTANQIKRDVSSPKPSVRRSAKIIVGWVMDEIDRQCQEAYALRKDKQYHQAYKVLDGVAARFAGYELPKKANDMFSDLRKHPQVKNEIRAQQLLAEANSFAKSDPIRALRIYRNIVRRYPKSLAKETAQEKIKELDKRP